MDERDNIDCNESVTYTYDELLSIFKREACHICKRPLEISYVAESALIDFNMYHGEYVRIE